MISHDLHPLNIKVFAGETFCRTGALLSSTLSAKATWETARFTFLDAKSGTYNVVPPR